MIGLFESENLELDEENFTLDINQDQKLDPNTSEIKNILEKMKI